MQLIGSKKKRMAIQNKKNEKDCSLTKGEDIEWTYKLEDGICTDSLALVTAAKFGLPESILRRATEFGSKLSDSTATNNEDSERDQVYIPEFSRDSDLRGPCLDDAIRLIERFTGAKSNVVHIPPMWTSPPSLEGHTCVYILEIDCSVLNSIANDNSNSISCSTRYYVGETDSLSRRLKQHRAKGDDWAQLTAVAIDIKGGKSEARYIESLLIRKMSIMGFNMVSVNDGRSIQTDQRINS